MGSGDIIAQKIVEKRKWDPSRTVKFGAIGLFAIGPLLNFWYAFLDRAYKGQSVMRTLKMVATDQVVMAPILCSSIIGLATFTRNWSVEEAKQKLSTSFCSALKKNYMVGRFLSGRQHSSSTSHSFRFTSGNHHLLLTSTLLLDTYDTSDESECSSEGNEEVNISDLTTQTLNTSETHNTSSANETDQSINSEGTAASSPRTASVSTSLLPIQPQQKNQNAVVLSREEALVRLIERTHYPIMQENGQRRYGPPPDWVGPAPARGCEIFIGKIPRDCFEDELVPVFESVGKVYMFRLMMDFSGCNRGYGFCIYTNREDTRKAVQKLDSYEIRKSKALGVCFSVDNCRLFVGGIPKTKTKEEIFFEMSKVTEGVRDVIVYPSVVDKTRNRGFAFVEYENHKAAAMARRKLIPGYYLDGSRIEVSWAKPVDKTDSLRAAQRATLQLGAVGLSLDQANIMNLLRSTPPGLTQSHDAFSINSLSLQHQQQQHLHQQQLLLSALISSADGRRSSTISENDSMATFRDLSSQPPGERIQNYNQNESFNHAYHINNHLLMPNALMSKPTTQPPMNNALQNQQSIWPDPVTIQTRLRQVEGINLDSHSCRSPSFNATVPIGGTQNAITGFENRLSKTPLTQAFRNGFNQTSFCDTLGKRLLIWAVNINWASTYLHKSALSYHTAGSDPFTKKDRSSYNYDQNDFAITSTQCANLQPNLDSINHPIFNTQFATQRAGESPTVNSLLFTNTQMQLSLAEKLRRRQAAMQQLPKGFTETLMPQIAQIPDNLLHDQMNPPSLLPFLTNHFDFLNDQGYRPASPGSRETMSSSPIEVPDLKFSVDELIMDDEQRFQLTPTNTLS
ncbi:unnamed protein product [Taenia asiatica]|uniref:APOBEC1 complementation factor n=1 Tax=Taenia asiatica TaxID=60517 RepID=A0A0R3VWX4_TAEAS|nr:unnamed protein product [Taenia asiatica]